MQILFQQYTHIGKRQNNEDYVASDIHKGNFIVCDGVGGRNKGEIASELTCSTILNYLETKNPITPKDMIISSELSSKAICNYIKANPESLGMATTLAFLHLYDGGALVAHVGDSRVYQIRNGEIILKTADHSLVSELVASGFITAEQARTHPKKNVVTRAIQSSEIEIAIPDVLETKDIQKNDFFILCTDGFLEAIDDESIKNYFLHDSDVEILTQKVKRICEQNSNDNNSAIIIKITEK